MSKDLQRVRWLTIPVVCLFTAALVGCPPDKGPSPAEQPAVEEPTLEEPVEEPAVEDPTIEDPTIEEPTIEEPAVETPMEEPAAEEPAVEAPMEEPAAEEPAEQPAAEEPAAEQPAAEEPVVEAPMEGPAAEEPAEQPAAEEPAAETPMEQPATEEPVAEKPAAEEPAVETPMEQPAAEEPAAEEPAAEETAEQGELSEPIAQAELLVELPKKYNSPDGMCLLPNGDVIVSVPNVNDRSFPAVLLRVKPDNTYEELMKSPPHPETGEAFPFGVAADEKGDLFLADLQWFANPENPGRNSRVLWIPMEDGKPGEPKSIIEGLVVANGVLIRDGYIYVTDTTMKPGTKPLVTGVFRFPLEEAKKETIRVTQPPEDDPHCVGTFLTHNPDVGFGADGVTMDNDGNLYVSDFADGLLYKIEFEEDGTPKPPALFAKAPFMISADGIFFDTKREVIFVADSLANAVQMVFLDGTVRTLAQDPENDGSDGRLDQPSETLVRGDELIVCNFDFPVPGGVNKKFDAPYTISVIKLPESLRD